MAQVAYGAFYAAAPVAGDTDWGVASVVMGQDSLQEEVSLFCSKLELSKIELVTTAIRASTPNFKIRIFPWCRRVMQNSPDVSEAHMAP